MFQRHWKTCAYWVLFLAFLFGLGSTIYWFESHEPIWESACQPKSSDEENKWVLEIHFSSDDEKLITYAGGMFAWAALDGESEDVLEPDSVTIWNRSTGELLARYPQKGNYIETPTFSQDYRFCVGQIRVSEKGNAEADDKTFLSLVDLLQGRETVIPAFDQRVNSEYKFSPNGEIFYCFDTEGDEIGDLSIYETSSGKKLDHRRSYRFLRFTDKYLVFQSAQQPTHDTIELWSLSQHKVADTFRKDGWRVSDVSRDGHAMVMSRIPLKGELVEEYALWNLASRQFEIRPDAWVRSWGELAPNGKWTANRELPGFSLWDVGAEKKVASLKSDSLDCQFSPDSNVLALPYAKMFVGLKPTLGFLQPKSDALKVVAVPSMDVLWTHGWGDFACGVTFNPDSQSIIAAFETERDVLVFTDPCAISATL